MQRWEAEPIVRTLRLIARFIVADIQTLLADRANFWISLFHSVLNLVTGVLAISVIFGQVESMRGWTQASTLALLGVYLTLTALSDLFIGPSLSKIAGLEGDIHQGRFDFTLLKPVNPQLLVTFQRWNPMAVLDVLLGLGVVGFASAQLGQSLRVPDILSFLAMLGAALTLMYALVLIGAALTFWKPDFLFLWFFNMMLQTARYPVGMYPGWLRLILTWVLPVGLMTTVPAQALTGMLSPPMAIGAVLLALAFLIAASILFRVGIRRYASASS